MKKNSLLLIFVNSLFNPSFYRELINESFGKAFGYLYLLLVILGVIQSTYFGSKLIPLYPVLERKVQLFKKLAMKFYPTELELSLKNGELSTNVKEPFYLYFPKELFGEKTDTPIAVIDTAAKLDDYESYKIPVLITKKGLIAPGKDNDSRVYLFSSILKESKVKEFSFDKKMFQTLVDQAVPVVNKVPQYVRLAVISFLVVWPFLGSLLYLGWKLLTLLISTVVLVLISRVLKKEIAFAQLYILSMFGITLPLMISQIQFYVGTKLPALLQNGWVGVAAFFLMMTLAITQFPPAKE